MSEHNITKQCNQGITSYLIAEPILLIAGFHYSNKYLVTFFANSVFLDIRCYRLVTGLLLILIVSECFCVFQLVSACFRMFHFFFAFFQSRVTFSDFQIRVTNRYQKYFEKWKRMEKEINNQPSNRDA